MAESKDYSPQANIDRIYTWSHILHNEKLFGLGWNSPGGETYLMDHLPKLKLQPRHSVLDVGCGTGGASFYMAKWCGVHVHGVDLSARSIKVAKERLAQEDQEVRDKIGFEHADASQLDYKSSNYDVVFSYGVIFFIAEKELLYKKLYNCLKPGGSLFIGDLCHGDQNHYSKEIREAIKEKEMTWRTISEYKALIEGVGFKGVKATDYTARECELLERDLKYFEPKKEAFIKEYSEKDYESHVKYWTDFLKWEQARSALWVIFQARK